MPSELLGSFAGEDQDLEKQIGCVAAIFQMFDRHIFLARQQRDRHEHKKIPSGTIPTGLYILYLILVSLLSFDLCHSHKQKREN